MNWFWFALIALICWSGSDLFSKIGCCGEKDKTAHLKMVVAVGLVMGLHAAYMIVFHHVSVTWDVVWTYLPVSLLYILSMTLGYVGLRYIELSISSPICNSSGALVAVLCLCLAAGIGCLVYLLARREKFTFKAELPKYVGAACETVGQLFYIYALADEEHVMMSAPIISAYCVASVLWSRLFLKEKLSWKHYLMIGFVVAGIVILGIYDI